jgi:hypothetical protein
MTIYTPIALTENTINSFRPTRLAIKELTGQYYFCKSIRKNIEKYTGSGKRWKDRIKKYGRASIRTLWVSDWYHDPEEIQKIALHFSKENEIVESALWANLQPENGLDGGTADCATWFTAEPSVTKRNNTNTERYGSACAANKNGGKESKVTTKKLLDRVEVLQLKKLCRIKRVSLPRGWWYGTDEDLKFKIANLETIPTPTIVTSGYNVSQLKRHSLINRENVQILIELKEQYKLKLGTNWFQKSDDWINSRILEVVLVLSHNHLPT